MIGSAAVLLSFAVCGIETIPSSLGGTGQPALEVLLFACLISPVLENGLMVGLFRALERWFPTAIAAATAAAVLALMHSIDGWIKPLIVLPAFLVFASTYQDYRSRPAFAFYTSCCVHAVANAAIIVLLLIIRSKS